MTREELTHLLRAASTIAGDGEILVVGSQAILASFDEDELPDEATNVDRGRSDLSRRSGSPEGR